MFVYLSVAKDINNHGTNMVLFYIEASYMSREGLQLFLQLLRSSAMV